MELCSAVDSHKVHLQPWQNYGMREGAPCVCQHVQDWSFRLRNSSIHGEVKQHSKSALCECTTTS